MDPSKPQFVSGVLPSPVTAMVELGDQRGRQLGFPTANLHRADCNEQMRGVYAAIACTADGVWWPAAVNVGRRPTFGGDVRTAIEVHLIGFAGDIYDEMLTVRFLQRLRDEVRFESIEALIFATTSMPPRLQSLQRGCSSFDLPLWARRVAGAY
ncbi:MAG TPA: riboflavin kinase [Ilumatobacteraceae bacterium]|nr:riboflavin kinase [Ilumatobacteraceae bacterium]